jgi:glutamate-1-semialdehyde 2,1-aminomutase
VVAFRDGLDDVEPDPAEPMPIPHPASLAAAEAVCSILKNDSVYDRLEERGEQLQTGLEALAERFSRPLRINRLGSAFALYMAEGPITDRAAAEASDGDSYGRLAEALLDEGVLLPQLPARTAFVSSAHGAKDVDETLAACEQVLLRFHQEDLP